MQKSALRKTKKIQSKKLNHHILKKKKGNKIMTKEKLQNWSLSEYNEDTNDQLDYYINERQCNVNDKAYLYNHANDTLTEMTILHIISRTDDIKYYDKLLENDNVLIDGEDKYNADTSAEFITDNDCYLVWFKYASPIVESINIPEMENKKDKYIRKIKHKIERYEKRIADYTTKIKTNSLNEHGHWSLGYFEGRKSILEDILDELEML